MNLSTLVAPHSRHWRWIAALATLIGVLAIVSTYRVFNNMYDEPAHLAAGMEWLSRGQYTYEPQHPPLSRIASAIGPWLAGETSKRNTGMYEEGRLILGRGAHYERTLVLSRFGQLPFFLVIALLTWYWARRLTDERTAALALVLVVANPNVLAHAGVAGTDIGPAAMMPAALLAWALWLDRPTYGRSVTLGVLVALCGLTKFSAMAYWVPAATLVALFVIYARGELFRPRVQLRLAAPLGLAVGIAAFVTWATYRFSVGRVGALVLPAPEFFTGLRDFFRHGTGGHPAFLFGRVRLGGWWYYDIVATLVKTPIPLLIFGAVGTVLLARALLRYRPSDATSSRSPEPAPESVALLAGIAAVLVVATLTPVDIGIRLLLPMYPLMAVLAAMGMTWGWRRWRQSSNRFFVLALLGWMVADAVIAHPDHIAYFNLLAGRNPEGVLVDSNLDWGQDLYRLRDATRELKIDSLRVHYFGTAEFVAVGLERSRRLRPNEQTTGWVAASETFYAGEWSGAALDWLRAYEPVARVGKSIRLYYIKPAAAQR